MLTHYIKTSLDELRNDIDVYASKDMPWIKNVTADFFNELDVTPDVYIKEIVSGVRKFDAMAILLACISHNIHAMLLLQKSYWTSRSRNDYAMHDIHQIGICWCRECLSLLYPLKWRVRSKEMLCTTLNLRTKVPKSAEKSDDADLPEDLAEDLLPTDMDETDSSDDESSNVANDSRENNFCR